MTPEEAKRKLQVLVEAYGEPVPTIPTPHKITMTVFVNDGPYPLRLHVNPAIARGELQAIFSALITLIATSGIAVT